MVCAEANCRLPSTGSVNSEGVTGSVFAVIAMVLFFLRSRRWRTRPSTFRVHDLASEFVPTPTDIVVSEMKRASNPVGFHGPRSTPGSSTSKMKIPLLEIPPQAAASAAGSLDGNSMR